MKKICRRIHLSLAFAFITFLIMLVAMVCVYMGIIFLIELGIIENMHFLKIPIFIFALISLIVGTIISIVFSDHPLLPIHQLMDATDQIAEGDYTVRLKLKGLGELEELSNKFNHMAEELQSVEMLRSDFVNNFSHEFKTPITSIRGFAKALKWEDLSDEERNEYLDVIISESDRLSELATNVLNLSKIEQQSILTNKTNFNVAEQIRLVIALLESKWNSKHLEIQFDSKEIYLCGNEEMLKQVWINLLDNAIKFSHEYGTIRIEIVEMENQIQFTFSNQTDPIDPKSIPHIFDKFYQGDLSHTTKGNGLGLTLVKKIIDLHHGEIRLVKSDDLETVFLVRLFSSLEI